MYSSTPDLVDLDTSYTGVDEYAQFNPLAITYFKSALLLTLSAEWLTKVAPS